MNPVEPRKGNGERMGTSRAREKAPRHASLTVVLLLVLPTLLGFISGPIASGVLDMTAFNNETNVHESIGKSDGMLTIGSDGMWSNVLTDPAGRLSPAMAYDSQSDRVILFGGISSVSGYYGDTWAFDYDSNTWTNMKPAMNPSARYGHAMAYDSQSDRIILFGGCDQAGHRLDDTWAYDFEGNVWTAMNPDTSPGGRDGHAMAYDSQSDWIMLFGQYEGIFSETWTYDFETNLWANKSSAIQPSIRSYLALAYDSQSDRTILFGGGYPLSNETWAYDSDTNTWTNMSQATRPSARWEHAMAYDSQSDRVVLFGGRADYDPLPNDTWAYDFETNTWICQNPVAAPSARVCSAMAYDSESDRVVMFGSSENTETWAYNLDLDAWSNVGAPRPSGRYSCAVAYDTSSDRVILFGGSESWSWSLAGDNETWAYDFETNTWTNMNPAIHPSARYWHAMAYDSQSDRIILFGGYPLSDETWAYDYDTNTWTNTSPATKPAARFGHAMSYDEQSDRVILFGGSTSPYLDSFNDTWAYEFDTNTWTKMNPSSSPSAGWTPAMAYDSLSDRVIMFGGAKFNGYDFLPNDETWAYDYDRDTWTNMNPATKPPTLYGHAIAYDSQSDCIVLFGGKDFTFRTNQTWVYDFDVNTWTEMNPVPAPMIRANHAMAYDSQSDRIVLVGGELFGAAIDDSWVYESPLNSPRAPAVLQVVPGDTYVSLAWQAPSSDGGSPITNYTICRATVSGGESVLVTVGDIHTYLDIGLINGVTYYYQIAAANTVGEGPWSSEVSATPASVPTSPQSLLATPGDARVILTWQPPASNGGSPTNGYRLYRGVSPGGESILVELGAVLNYTDVGLTNGVTCYYRASAVNIMGEGPLSGEVSAMPATTPSSPRSLGATSGDGQVALYWQVSLSEGGSPVTNYRLYRGLSPGDESLLLELGNVLMHTDTGLMNDVTCYYQVTAVNAIGEGPRSNEASATPGHLSIPSPVTGLSATAEDRQVTLQWEPPFLDGGTPVTNYTIYRGTTSGGESYLTTLGNVLAYTDSGLENGVTYYYQVSATSSIGEGPRSSEIQATPETAPSAPRNLLGTPAPGEVALAWGTPSSSGGMPVTNYTIYRGTSSGSEMLLVELGDVLTYTDMGLTNGVTYYYQVSATNSIGEGSKSSEVQATPGAPPTAPRSLSATPAAGQVTLTWQAPSSDGGLPISGYEIYRSTSSGDESFLVRIGVVLTYSNTGLTNGVTYYYQVTALNPMGDSPLSSEVSAKPIAAPTSPLSVQIDADPKSGFVPLAVSFSCSVTGGIMPCTYLWEFDDGSTSTVQNPTHTYEYVGNYHVNLTVTDALGDITKKTVEIEVTTVTTGAGTPWQTIVILGTVGAAAVAIAVVLLVRRRS
jgi:PKD repeat protein